MLLYADQPGLSSILAFAYSHFELHPGRIEILDIVPAQHLYHFTDSIFLVGRDQQVSMVSHQNKRMQLTIVLEDRIL
jgi:hypothetical protein